jgi:transcriptional regulator with XRE-family HTH domain
MGGNDTGTFLISERLDKGWSIERAAHEIGIAPNTLRRLEAGGVPYPATGFKVAQFYDRRPSELWPAKGIAVDGSKGEA